MRMRITSWIRLLKLYRKDFSREGGWYGGAEKPGSQPRAGSIYAILKVRSVDVRGPKEKNIENEGQNLAYHVKF